MKAEVEKATEGSRAYLQSDGGDIDLIEVDEEKTVIKVRLRKSVMAVPRPNQVSNWE